MKEISFEETSKRMWILVDFYNKDINRFREEVMIQEALWLNELNGDDFCIGYQVYRNISYNECMEIANELHEFLEDLPYCSNAVAIAYVNRIQGCDMDAMY